MKINFSVLDKALSLNQATILVLENTDVFSNFVRNIYSYSDRSEIQFFDAQAKTVKEAELMIVTDIMGYDVNAPAILKLIHSDLESQFNDKPEVKSMVEKLADTITELISFECLENELDLEYDEITLLELIKALGVKVETRSDTVFEKMFEILQIYKYLTKKKLLIFINVLSYFKHDEVKELLDYVTLSNMTVLFVEPRKYTAFPQYVIDHDYFLISENML